MQKFKEFIYATPTLKEMLENYTNNLKTDFKMSTSACLPIFTLNVNGPYAPNKRHRWLIEWKDTTHLYDAYQRPTSELNIHKDWKWEVEKDISCRWKRQATGIVMLIGGKQLLNQSRGLNTPFTSAADYPEKKISVRQEWPEMAQQPDGLSGYTQDIPSQISRTHSFQVCRETSSRQITRLTTKQGSTN